MRQMPFEWAEQSDPEQSSDVVLDPETSETVIELMARTLLAVVRPVEEEANDER